MIERDFSGDTTITTSLEQQRYAPDTLHNRAAAAAQAGRLVEAKAMLREALTLDPTNVQLLIDLGRVCADRKDHETTILSCKRALRVKPDEPQALMLLAESMRQTDRFEEALELYERLQIVAPQTSMLDHCMAIALSGLRRYDESEIYYLRALKRGEHNLLTNWEHAHLQLRVGNLAEGWDGYALRFEAGQFSNVRRYNFGIPDWTGQPLAGKTILVHAEQGLGDQIMFASIIPELQAEGARVILAASFELVDLFADSFPDIPVYGILRDADAERWWAALPKLDYEAPIGQLAVLRRRTFDSYVRRPYVKVNLTRVNRMQRYLDTVAPQWSDREQNRLRVGLMWASNPALFDWHAARRGRRKTIPADQLGRLRSVKNTLFVSVQSRQSGKQAAYVPKMDIVDCAETLDTMADTAALISQLDVVITVDTSVAHLAGAMGKRTFVMVALDADWRWLLDRSDSIWYENMTIVRQKIEGDWSHVITEIGIALDQMVDGNAQVPIIRGEADAPQAMVVTGHA